MSSTIYNKVFSVELSHDFNETVNKFIFNRTVEIAPTAECAALMTKGRMRFIRTPKGFTVFYQAYLDDTNTQQPLVKLGDDSMFIFTVKLKDDVDEFLNVTDLNASPKTYTAGSKYLLNGSDTQLLLSPALVDQLRPAVFTYTFKAYFPLNTTNPYSGNVDITITDEWNVTTIFSFTDVACDPATGIYTLPLDFSKYPKGIYNIEVTKHLSSDVVHESELYIDSDLATQNIFGLIRIKYVASVDLYDGEDIFTYAFPNRTVKWRYYVAVKSPSTYFTDGNLLMIEDTASPSPVYQFSVLNGQPCSTFQLNGFNTVVFTSELIVDPSQGIPFKETPIKTFRLQQTALTTKTVINPLQNAILSGVDSDRANTGDGPYAEIFIVIDELI